jgi:hypothetical protein
MYENRKDQPRYSVHTSPLLNQVRQTLRLKHYSRSTEKSYIYYILAHYGDKRLWSEPKTPYQGSSHF